MITQSAKFRKFGFIFDPPQTCRARREPPVKKGAPQEARPAQCRTREGPCQVKRERRCEKAQAGEHSPCVPTHQFPDRPKSVIYGRHGLEHDAFRSNRASCSRFLKTHRLTPESGAHFFARCFSLPGLRTSAMPIRRDDVALPHRDAAAARRCRRPAGRCRFCAA